MLALLALADAAGADGAARVCPRAARDYARLRDLPDGVAGALGFPIAERGAPWNATDAVGPGPLLPFARFLAARQTGCTLVLRYEHGGIAHTDESAILVLRGGRWARLGAR
jgi:hypothetical protein